MRSATSRSRCHRVAVPSLTHAAALSSTCQTSGLARGARIFLATSPEDALSAEMRQAIELRLAGLREDGQPVPHPSTVAATVITLDAA